MKRGRVAYAGAIHEAYPEGDNVRLADGRIRQEHEVVWLPPIEIGTIFALGLNYAEHAKELQFSSQEEPLVFLKGPGTVIGHRGVTRRPAGVAFMHYECELAVVIGRTAKNVRREAALDYVAGYTIANDYAIRDYLENYYRPNTTAVDSKELSIRCRVADSGTAVRGIDACDAIRTMTARSRWSERRAIGGDRAVGGSPAH